MFQLKLTNTIILYYIIYYIIHYDYEYERNYRIQREIHFR